MIVNVVYPLVLLSVYDVTALNFSRTGSIALGRHSGAHAFVFQAEGEIVEEQVGALQVQDNYWNEIGSRREELTETARRGDPSAQMCE